MTMSDLPPVEVKSSEKLRAFFEMIDETDFHHDYQPNIGELHVCFGGRWQLFYVDKRVLHDEAHDDEAFYDARRLAEGMDK